MRSILRLSLLLLALGAAACSSSAGTTCKSTCGMENRACASADGTGTACGACVDGFALDGDTCTTLRTCDTLACAGQGRACTTGGPRTHASCGGCLGGAVEVAGSCQHLTCGAPQGTASLTAACDVLHRACVDAPTGATCGPCQTGWAEMSGSCVATATCASLGCDGRHRSCVTATADTNTTCGPCQPGYVASGASCVADTGATCDGRGVASIAKRCADLKRLCTPAAGGATCGACDTGFVVDPDTNTCLEMKSCADLDCEAQHRACLDEPTGHCGACAGGFIDDAGKCRAPTECFDAKASPAGLRCPTGQQCVPAAGGKDAYCRVGCADGELWNGRQCAPCPPCDQDGEDGAWPWATASGQCICKTKPGSFYSVAGAMGAVTCDADGDGWLRESARSAMASKDPSLQANAQCTLRSIDRFVYVNEAGQRKTATLPAPLDLYESDRNDDDTILAATWDQLGLPADRNGGPLSAAELNRLTKLCRSPNADYNDNGAPDVYEWGGQPLAPALRPEQAAFNANAYFAELYWGAYEAGAAASGPGQWVIHEKSRGSDAARPTTERVPLGYKDNDDAGWRSCAIQRDAAWGKQDPPIGMDFAAISDPGDATFGGLNLESQFKCVVVDPQPTATHPNAMPAGAMVTAGYRTQLCEIATGAKANAGNASLTDFACAQLDASMAQAGDVLWASMPYLPNGPLPGDPPYQRGCISACVSRLPECSQAFAGTVMSSDKPVVKCHDDPAKFGAFVSCEGAELCDNKPNYAGNVTDDPAKLIDVGGPCTVDGGVGRCAQGVWRCAKTGIFSSGPWQKVCVGTATSSTEVCNGIDDNCDGMVDNIRANQACDTGLLGECQFGTLTCDKGLPVCRGQASRPEVCNDGKDQDCDGVPDNSPEIPVDECPKEMVVFYEDHDRDGWPTSKKRCLCGPEGDYVIKEFDLYYGPFANFHLDSNGNIKTDCCDSDTTTHPLADYSAVRDACHSFDRDCNGVAERRYANSDSGCSTGATSCGSPSGTFRQDVDCGFSAPYNYGCTSWVDGCHRYYDRNLTQECK